MVGKREGTFEVWSDFKLGIVVFKVPKVEQDLDDDAKSAYGQSTEVGYAYGLSPEDAVSIGLSMANNAILVAEHTGIPIAIDVIQPLFDRLAVGLRTESNEKPSDVKDLATVVSNGGNVCIQLGDGDVFVINPENARRLADSLAETAAHAEGGRWVGTSKVEGGTSGGDA